MTASANRPYWKRKRCLIGSALLLSAAYPATHGPAVYAAKRGFIRVETYDVLYGPLLRLRPALPEPLAVGYGEYTAWWFERALSD